MNPSSLPQKVTIIICVQTHSFTVMHHMHKKANHVPIYVKKNHCSFPHSYTLRCRNAPVIVQICHCQAVSKIGTHLFPKDDLLQQKLWLSFIWKNHSTLRLISGSPCHNCRVIIAQELLFFENWITCEWKCLRIRDAVFDNWMLIWR